MIWKAQTRLVRSGWHVRDDDVGEAGTTMMQSGCTMTRLGGTDDGWEVVVWRVHDGNGNVTTNLRSSR
jgi:hypothetical protein